MSASNKKKIRKEQNAETMTARQTQEQAEAKKLKTMTIAFVVVLALVVCVFLGTQISRLSTRYGWMEKLTTAYTVGDHKLNSITMNYFFIDAVKSDYQNASYYAQYYSSSGQTMDIKTFLGYDPNLPLNSQQKDAATGQTWADYYWEIATENAKAIYAMYDVAMAAGHTLSAESQTQLQSELSHIEMYKEIYGSEDAFLQEVYCNGASVKSYTDYLTVRYIASEYYQAHQASLSYTAEQRDAFLQTCPNDYTSYSYNYYSLNCHNFMDAHEHTEGTTHTPEETEAARAAAEAAANKLAEATSVEALDKAIAELDAQMNPTEPAATEPAATEPGATEPEATEATATEPEATEATATEPAATEATATEPGATDAAATEPGATEPEATEPAATTPSKPVPTSTSAEDVLYTNISDAKIKEWIATEGLQPGNTKVIPVTSSSTDANGATTETVTGYKVVMYVAKNDNTRKLSNVRHILIAPEGGTFDEKTGQTTYSTEEKAAAKAEAEALLQQWKDAGSSKDNFIALVSQHSEDTASVPNGGLIADISINSSYMEAFLEWSVDPIRQVGDTAVVETSYGSHIMYFDSYGTLSDRDTMIDEDMISRDMTAWEESVINAVTVKPGKTTRIRMDCLASYTSF